MSGTTGTKCKARLLSDPTGKTECDKVAPSVDGRLCAFHARQCQGLYRGYKRRNAQLDALAKDEPLYLANTRVALVKQTFKDVEDEDTLNALFEYLFRKYNLMERVIRGRKLHHSHFFAIDNDYGHEKYLRHLQSEKVIIGRALERLGKRSAQILYKQKKWLDWVESCQANEESNRENESRKLQLEAQLFRRHQKEVERRQRELREQEHRRLQDVLLDAAYNERQSELNNEHQDEWDPVQDVVEDERGVYVDLIKYFLMLKDQEESAPAEEGEAMDTTVVGENAPALSKSAKKRAKKAKAAAKPASSGPDKESDARRADTIEMETKAEIRKRLQEGVEYSRKSGYHVVGTLETPLALHEKAAAIPDDEIEILLEEIAEVKLLLFCRLLLSHGSLLPVALKVNSVEEFLEHPEVTSSSLRDLCLEVERPALQDVRDACADFVRAKAGEEDMDEHMDENEDDWEDEDEEHIPERYKWHFGRASEPLPETFKTKREQRIRKKQRNREQKLLGSDTPELDFGAPVEDENMNNRRVRIKVCGRYINNYPSERAMPRGGWYHFCLIAKDSDLHDAIELCRNWNEFFELNTLCVYHYFPAAKWMVWAGDHQRLQLLRMGFIPYYQSDRADLLTIHEQTGSRGMARRSHYIREARNFICGHIKRNDAASRRLIQYLSMMTFELILLVRDAKTGKILVKPPKEERWLVREKVGWGRASRNEYTNIASVDAKFFETMDQLRKWHFNFDDHYDVYIWDASSAGRAFSFIYERLMEVLIKAHRVREPKDIYNPVAPILKTLARDPETQRTRTIKPGEEVQSLWDQLDGPEARVRFVDLRKGLDADYFDVLKYNEADELEDQILFPEEANEGRTNNLFRPDTSAMAQFEQGNLGDMRRFVYDLGSDEELDSEDESDWASSEGSHSSKEDEEMASDMDEEGYFFSNEEDAENWEREQAHKSANADKAWDEFSEHFAKYFSLGPNSSSRRQHVLFDIFNDPSKPLDLSKIPADHRKSDADMMCLMRLSLMTQRNYDDTSRASMDAEFERYINRQKSKVFKQAFHRADIQPRAPWQYFIQGLAIRHMDDYQMTKLTLGPFEMIGAMGLADKMSIIDKRIVDDAFMAYAAISLFFAEECKAFLESKNGSLFKLPYFDISSLVDQAERAKHVPDRRTNQSNKLMPKSFWDEWDKICKENHRDMTDGMIEHFYPAEWDKVVRPKIARLYKAGIICNTYALQTAGIAVAAREPNRERDLYMDFRLSLEDVGQFSHLQDPRLFPRATLLAKASDFALKHPNARFAALRIWSSDYFYPLMLGHWNRPNTSFIDSKGRGWEFKFVPKDMPFAEWSIHEQCRLRLRPFMDFFGENVIVATDLYLVMGKDEAELRRLAAGVAFAVQTEPWRMEIDWWRSFVGVDVKFLQDLDLAWLESCKDEETKS